MKNILVTLVIATIIVLIRMNTSGLSFEKDLMAKANEFNKQLPVMVNKETRLDAMVGGPGKRITYNYTLLNYSKDQINPAELKATMEPLIKNTVNTDPKLRLFRDNEATLVYYYKDKNGAYLFDVEVTPSMYK